MGIFDRFRRRGRTPASLQPVGVELPLQPTGEGLADAIGDFGLALSREAGGNVVCSALSIYEAWLRVWAGSREACRDELTRALGLGGVGQVREALVGMLEAVTRPRPQCTVQAANAIWVRSGLRVDETFEAQWGGSTRELDLSSPTSAAQVVNRWVDQHTHGMVQDIVDERSIAPDTAMLLANAIYLKATWAQTFESWRTEPRPFQTAAGTPVEVPTLWDRGHYECVANRDFELLRKPYVGGDLALVLVLPQPGRFEAVSTALTFATVRQALAGAQERDTVLRLPRFSVASAPEVDPLLRSRGAAAIYGPRTANLSGLSPDALQPGAELFVSETRHKARIDVDEEGTEAGAATVVGGPTGAGGPRVDPYFFTVDRPFLFFVIERSTSVPLFGGQVVDPRMG